MKRLALLASLALFACQPRPLATPAPVAAPAAVVAPAPEEKSVHPGANAQYLGPDLEVGPWILRFESGGREIYNRRREILAATKLAPGAAVADIGAGTGLFTMLFAEAVGPTGAVYAVDIVPRFIEHIGKRAREAGARQVKPVLGTERSVGLPAASVEVAFLCDVYHHLEYPRSSLASIRSALRPGGTLVVIDFEREPGKSAEWVLGHVRAGKGQVTQEIEAAGFVKLEEVPLLKENYLLRFRRP